MRAYGARTTDKLLIFLFKTLEQRSLIRPYPYHYALKYSFALRLLSIFSVVVVSHAFAHSGTNM